MPIAADRPIVTLVGLFSASNNFSVWGCVAHIINTAKYELNRFESFHYEEVRKSGYISHSVRRPIHQCWHSLRVFY